MTWEDEFNERFSKLVSEDDGAEPLTHIQADIMLTFMRSTLWDLMDGQLQYNTIGVAANLVTPFLFRQVLGAERITMLEDTEPGEDVDEHVVAAELSGELNRLSRYFTELSMAVGNIQAVPPAEQTPGAVRDEFVQLVLSASSQMDDPDVWLQIKQDLGISR